MSSLKKKNRSELVSIIHQQQREIDALRQRIEVLEAADVGELRREVNELNTWKERAEEQIRQLQISAGMTQGLMIFTGASVLALLGEKALEVLQELPSAIEAELQAEMQKTLGEVVTGIVNAVAEIDGVSKEAWEKQRHIIEVRASTLPPLKRALFDALDQLAQPSQFGTRLHISLLQTVEFEQKFDSQQLEKIEVLTAALDTCSNLWPLAAVNSLAPLLRYVGFDEVAEAAGELIDSLEQGENAPAKLIRRVRSDLIDIEAIPQQTKPSTIREYLRDGYQLSQYGVSPDQAVARGLVVGSPTHFKRAQKAYMGLLTLYDRTIELPPNEALETLEAFSCQLQEAANRLDTKQLVAEVSVELAQ